MPSQHVTFADGKTQGYLAVPDSGKGPGVIVLQEWWGLVPHIENVCDRFAKEGFTALAPDLYHGESTTSPDDAGKLMMALNIDRTERDLAGAVDFLKAHEAVSSSGLGTVGFCMGGQLSLFAATKNPSVKACVVYYGIHPNVKPDYTALNGPVLGFFGEKDSMVTPDTVAELEKQIKDAGKTCDFTIYPGADHAFFNDSRGEVYHAKAAADSWARMLDFFRRELA